MEGDILLSLHNMVTEYLSQCLFIVLDHAVVLHLQILHFVVPK